MKTQLALLTIAVLLGVAIVSAQQEAEAPVWHKDWPTAQRLALKDGKPIFAIFVCQH